MTWTRAWLYRVSTNACLPVSLRLADVRRWDGSADVPLRYEVDRG